MNRPDDSSPGTRNPGTGNISDSDLDEAKRAAHATEPGMGSEGSSVDDPNTIADDVVDPDHDGDTGYPPSKPVPADGGGPLP